ncbi:MAG: carbohydrate ABC transporter permease [Actinobacteria bacterium]|nr:carbohydrate ABC transporter permease [Actinomycetota bacterium]
MSHPAKGKSALLIKLTLWLITFTVVLPFLWLLKASVMDFANSQAGVLAWVRDSVVFTLAALIFSVLSSITAGFVMAILYIPFRKTMIVLTLITMLIPATAMAMPLYVLVDHIHLNDTILGLVIASSYYPFGAFLSYLYFSSAMPGDLVGMGRIDGLGDWGLFYHLGIPLSKSLWSIVTFFSFINLWNSYQLPKVLLNAPEHSTLPMGLELLYGRGTATVGILMLIPAVLLYLLSQRSIERGIFSGAVTG